MFARKEKPLPVAVLKPEPTKNTQQTEDAGIHLGEGYYWNPEALPNGHIVAIGASGSGKTQTLNAIAIEQQQQAIQRQESEKERRRAEREYSKAQIETQIQALDYQIHQLSTVTAPYEGTIKKVKWTGQSDHNLTAVITLAVNDNLSTIANSTGKPTPNTEFKQTIQAQP